VLSGDVVLREDGEGLAKELAFKSLVEDLVSVVGWVRSPSAEMRLF